MKEAPQLELNLTPQPGPPVQSRVAWRYRMTPDGLAEEGGGRRYLYGRWSRLFGCWEIDSVTGRSREFVPTIHFLRDAGTVFAHERVRAGLLRDWVMARPAGWRFEGHAAFAAFFADVPLAIRQLVAPMGPHQWVALDMIWQVPAFAGFIDAVTALGHRQFLFACLVMGRAALRSRSRRRALAAAMMSRRRRDLLSTLTGYPCTEATLRALYKLGAAPHPRSVYQNLIGAMTIPAAAKVLRHAPSIEPDLPAALLRIPDALRLPSLFALCDEHVSAQSLLMELDMVLPDVPNEDRQRCIAGLRAVRSWEDLFEWQARWLSRLRDRFPFPPPPIPGDDRLCPITDNGALRREGLRMHNCVRDMAGDVLKGRSYFYHWSGAEPATVMLERDPDRGWVLAEARGSWNDSLSPWTRYVIAERVWYQRGVVLGRWDEPPPFPSQFGSAVPGLLQDGEDEADAA